MLSYSKNVAFAWCLVSVAGLACVLAGQNDEGQCL
jgi:hypothetical protein